MSQEHYEGFLRERSGDPSLMAELASTHFQVANILIRGIKDRLKEVPPAPPIGISGISPPSPPPDGPDEAPPAPEVAPSAKDRPLQAPPPPPQPSIDKSGVPTPALPPFKPVDLASPPPSGGHWKTIVADAIRHNEVAISLYGQLIRRHHVDKVREYQLCQKQQLLLIQLRAASDPSEVLRVIGAGAGLGGGAPFTMIGD